MGMQIINDVHSQQELDEMYPIESEHRLEEYGDTVRNILSGEDPRMALVIGPCSIHDPDAAYEYADRLARLQEEVQDRLFLIMRLYLQKPRTTFGWEGMMKQPDPMGEPNIREGVRVCREMMYKIGKQLPLADEMLYTHNAHPEANFDRMLTYIAVGARSTQNSEHRHLASALDSVVGVKNPTSGDIVEGVDGVEVTQGRHNLYLAGKHVQTDGNKFAHLILRGGKSGSNYGAQSIALAAEELRKRELHNPAIVVDCAHDQIKVNGRGKMPELMDYVAQSVMLGKRMEIPGSELVRGLMIESNLKEGNQKIGPDMEYGKSITDPCRGWEASEQLVLDIADQVDNLIGRGIRA